MSLIDGIYWQNVYESDKPKEKTSETNYQRLVWKTPEELAAWLRVVADCEGCPVTENFDECRHGKDCEDKWLEWLRQGAT